MHIHAHGWLHRDFKPENVLVGFDSFLRIADFGSACLSGSEDCKRWRCAPLHLT